ncbi:hypothetical protein GJ744_007327 [Endocarpon pusillum]|uniref:DUF2293 domain-containing protein n=1 Tax=Endocarpon pusillum TaxID=364733 RepID=A0A8H7A3X0_9EURO|nr:hypothetical protein GJ744_007327 [Endocarpon pusillum]
MLTPIYILTQKRSIHVGSEGSESGSKSVDSETKTSRVYRNKHGEEIIFNTKNKTKILPQGYVFVPSGNIFMTRNCRKLSQKSYALYRPESRKKGSTPIGLYVPRDVFEKVTSVFKAKRAKIDKDLRRALDEQYPRMPPAVKSELHTLISYQSDGLTGKSALKYMGIHIHNYVRDRHPPFTSLNLRNGKQHNKGISIGEVLASWRGEDKKVGEQARLEEEKEVEEEEGEEGDGGKRRGGGRQGGGKGEEL